MITRLLRNKSAQNAGWMIGGKIIQMIVSLIVGLLSARYLGPSNYGLINYAAAYVAFFTALCNLGINSVLVKEIIDNPENEGRVLGTSLMLKTMSSVLSALMIVAIVFVIDHDKPTTIAVVSLSTIGMVFHVFDTFNYWFQSKLKSKYVTGSTLIAYIITAVYRIVLLALHADVKMFALATSVDYFCVAIFIWISYKRCGGKKLSISFAYAKSLLSKSMHFILPSVMVSIYNQTDKVMLKQMISETELGYYSTAVTLTTIWCFVLQAIIDSIYPSIMKAAKVNEELFVKKNKQLYSIVFYISMAVSVLFVCFGHIAIQIMYGEAYLPAATPLKITTWLTAFSYLGVARNAWIVSKNKQKHLIYVYVSAAILNVLLNLVCIPLWGASGAAVASLIAQILTSIVVPFFIKELRENSIMMIEAIFLKGVR